MRLLLVFALNFGLSGLSFAAGKPSKQEIEKAIELSPVGKQGILKEKGPGLEFSIPETTGPLKAQASTGPLTADQVIDRLEQADAALKTLHCTYEQSLKIPGYGIDQKGSGELWFEKERKLRIEQKLPKTQTVVSDGELIWIHNPDTRQVLQQSWAAFESNQMVSRGLTQFGSYSRLRERYAVSASTTTPYVVTLKPKDVKDIPFTLELTLDAPDFIPTRTRMQLNEMEVTTSLSGIEVNPAIDSKAFVFEPPSGTTLMKTGPQ